MKVACGVSYYSETRQILIKTTYSGVRPQTGGVTRWLEAMLKCTVTGLVRLKLFLDLKVTFNSCARVSVSTRGRLSLTVYSLCCILQ